MSNSPFERRSSTRETITTLIMSFFLALVVWVFAIDQENPLERNEFAQPISIQVRGLGEELQSLQDLTKRTVTLTLRAPRRTWDSIEVDQFNAFVDLSNLGPGVHEVAVQVSVFNPDIEVIDQQPAQMRVQLEPIVSRQVPVQVEIMDAAAFGYDWQTPLVEPSEVLITGPATQVELVRVAQVEVFLRNAKTQVEQVRPLSPRDAQNQTVERVTVEPLMVQVVVPVVERPGRKEVAVLVQVDGQPATSHRITSVKSEPSTVVLLGSPEDLRQVPGYVETARLSIEGATSEIREQLKLLLPDGVSMLADPSVFVTVGIAPIESSLTVTSKPTVIGLGENLEATVSLEKVDVIVSGSIPQLEALESEDVQVILDLSGLLPGSHVILPRVESPEGIQVDGVLPQAIEVIITAIEATPEASPTNGAPTPEPSPTPERESLPGE